MPYFPVDDGLHSHPKVVKAGTHAMGLWVLSGSWSNDNGTDGFVPDYIAARLDPQYKKLAARLVAVRLWEPMEIDGETGWRFHQWADDGAGSRRNFTRAETEKRRQGWAERQAKSRERRGNVTRDKGVTPPVTHGNVTRDSRVSHNGSHGPVTESLSLSLSQPLSTSSKTGSGDLSGSLPKQDHSEVPKTAPAETAAERQRCKRYCDEHYSPDDRDCTGCHNAYGDCGYWSKLPAGEFGRRSAAKFAAGEL